MDPNEALKRARAAAKDLRDWPDNTQRFLNSVQDLVEHFDALDSWLVRGGFLPRDWEQTMTDPDRVAVGYDGVPFTTGDRVELHPGTDLWMRGARYGTVVGLVPTPDDRVRVKLDKLPRPLFESSADTFRKV